MGRLLELVPIRFSASTSHLSHAQELLQSISNPVAKSQRFICYIGSKFSQHKAPLTHLAKKQKAKRLPASNKDHWKPSSFCSPRKHPLIEFKWGPPSTHQMQIAVHGHVPQQPPAPNRADFAALGTQTPGPWRPVQQLHAPALHRCAAPEGWHSEKQKWSAKTCSAGEKGRVHESSIKIN